MHSPRDQLKNLFSIFFAVINIIISVSCIEPHTSSMNLFFPPKYMIPQLKKLSSSSSIQVLSDSCEFSYASLDFLIDMMQSRIDCICVISPQCEFANASSTYLPEQMHNCIGCICMVLSSMSSQMCP